MSSADTLTKEPSLVDVIGQRHSVRQYDAEVTIPREEVYEMLTLATQAPSSSNMQHWRFLVIESPELKAKLLPIANNQHQVVEASVVVAILGDKEGYRRAAEIYGGAAEAGYMAREVADSFIERSVALYASLPAERIREVAIIDATLAAMQLMLAARAKGYDTVPMGGFNRDKFVEAFDVGERYVPVMLLPIGKAAKPGHPTVRLPVTEVTYWNEMPSAPEQE